MAKHIEGWALQTEYRITVDAERAVEFAPALAELAFEFDATVLPQPEERQDVPFPFRKDLATEIYDNSSGETVWVVTKNNFDSFATASKLSAPLVSRAYNTIMRELNGRGCLRNDNSNPYHAWGKPVEPNAESNAQKIVGGLRVETIADLQIELAESEHIHSYGNRSKEILKELVVELFSPQDPAAS